MSSIPNTCGVTMTPFSRTHTLKLGCFYRTLGKKMLSLPRANSHSLVFPSSQFRRKCADVNLSQTHLSLSHCSQPTKGISVNFTLSKQTKNSQSLKKVASVNSTRHQLHLGLSSSNQRMNVKLPLSTSARVSRFNWSLKRTLWTVGSASAGVCLSFSTSGRVCAAAPMGSLDNDGRNASSINSSHGKKVYTDYSITGIPGDGRCLFRSVAHGACIRSGKPLPDETLQRVLADELRTMVADEFVKRREETEWFIEGDFDAYISRMRKPHVWGGEPELLMASHVLQMPITVYMQDDDCGGLIAIAEYGQEYGKENPIQVLYHGFGHYDALQIPGKKGAKSRL